VRKEPVLALQVLQPTNEDHEGDSWALLHMGRWTDPSEHGSRQQESLSFSIIMRLCMLDMSVHRSDPVLMPLHPAMIDLSLPTRRVGIGDMN